MDLTSLFAIIIVCLTLVILIAIPWLIISKVVRMLARSTKKTIHAIRK